MARATRPAAFGEAQTGDTLPLAWSWQKEKFLTELCRFPNLSSRLPQKSLPPHSPSSSLSHQPSTSPQSFLLPSPLSPPILSSSSAGQQPAAFVFAFLCCLLNPVLLATRGCQQRYLSPTSLPTFCLYRPKNPSTMSYGGGYSNRNGGSNGYSNGYDKSGGYGGSYGASNNYSHGYANIPKG